MSEFFDGVHARRRFQPGGQPRSRPALGPLAERSCDGAAEVEGLAKVLMTTHCRVDDVNFVVCSATGYT